MNPEGVAIRYERFEELPVWQAAIELAAAVYALTEEAQFRQRYPLRDQIERAAVSVSSNIAEGFERGTKQDLLNFLYIACGSAGEVRSMLCLLGKIQVFAERPRSSRLKIQGSRRKIQDAARFALQRMRQMFFGSLAAQHELSCERCSRIMVQSLRHG